MTEKELQELLSNDESYRIERTVSTGNMDKFQETICAFANDLPGKRQKGYLLIGVHDDGSISGLKVDDALMKKISGIRSDGNILPLPVMNTEKVSTPDGDVIVVEVTPSFDTPVRYRGRTFVRIGPRRDIASVEEERILIERCAAALPTFDTRPCREANLEDIPEKVKSLIINIDICKLSRCELQEKLDHATNHATISRQYLTKAYLRPAIDAGYVTMLLPEAPKSKKQKYYLTEKGLLVLKAIQQ